MQGLCSLQSPDTAYGQKKGEEKMKKQSSSGLCLIIAAYWLAAMLVFGLSGCAKHPGTPITPTYNITYTDNTQMIIGDKNKAESRPETPITQETTPTVKTSADTTTSNMWIYWLILTILVAGGVYFGWKKIIKKSI